MSLNSNSIVSDIIFTLCKDQDLLQDKIPKSIEENRDISEEMALYGLFLAIAENPEQTNWKRFMANLESIFGNPSQKEHHALIGQYILEGLSNFIASGELDSKWIKDSIGPKAKAYIISYEKVMGGKSTF